MAYLGETLETAEGFTIDVMRQYVIDCSDCGPIYTYDDGRPQRGGLPSSGDGFTVPETRAEALQLQREHHTSHAIWNEWYARARNAESDRQLRSEAILIFGSQVYG